MTRHAYTQMDVYELGYKMRANHILGPKDELDGKTYPSETHAVRLINKTNPFLLLSLENCSLLPWEGQVVTMDKC